MKFSNCLLLLSIAGLAVIVSGAGNCDAEFSDVASRTVRAVTVFEGRAKRRCALSDPADGESKISSNHTGVVFKVERILKGNFSGLAGISSRTGGWLVAVGYFHDKEHPEKCTRSLRSVMMGTSYIVFVANPAMINLKRRQDTERPPMPTFSISDQPEPTSTEVINIVHNYSCSKCAKPPKSRLSADKLALSVGEKLQLSCHKTGSPDSAAIWFKDDLPIEHTKRVQIKNNRRSSRLKIKKVTTSDFGTYQCVARNVLGDSIAANCTVSMKHVIPEEPPKKDHSVPCSEHSYCLNGGTCYILTPLNIRYCQCRSGYEGERCQLKHTGINAIKQLDEPNKDDGSCAVTFMAAGALLMSLGSWFLLIVIACKRYSQKTQRYKKMECSSDASSTYTKTHTLILQGSTETLPKSNCETVELGELSDTDRLAAIQACRGKSSASLLQYLVPSSFMRRQRLLAVSGSFD